MISARVILLSMALLALGNVSGHATVVPYQKLNLNERMALEESERRLVAYDKALASLDQQWKAGRVTRDSYREQNDALSLGIRQEAACQNAIVVRDPELPQRAKEVGETIEHVVIGVPVAVGYGVAYVACKCPQAFSAVSMIH